MAIAWSILVSSSLIGLMLSLSKKGVATDTLARSRPIRAKIAIAAAVAYPLLALPLVLYERLGPDALILSRKGYAILVLGRIVLLAVPATVLVIRGQGRLLAWPPSVVREWRRWWVPLLIGFAFVISYLPLQAVSYTRVSQAGGINLTSGTLIVLLAMIGSAWPEEAIFRVLLLTSLERRFSLPGAVMLSSTAFTVAHLPAQLLLSHMDIFTGLLYLGVFQFAAGLVLGFMWTQFRNAVANTVVHGVSDGIAEIFYVAGLPS